MHVKCHQIILLVIVSTEFPQISTHTLISALKSYSLGQTIKQAPLSNKHLPSPPPRSLTRILLYCTFIYNFNFNILCQYISV